jgi:UDP-2,3-diacylglucosamine pyrophosphatase LpxH
MDDKQIALITDLHFGVKKNSTLFLSSMISYFKNEFIPYLKSNGIKTIFMLGDFFDSRESINVKIKNEVHSLFKKDLCDFNIYMLLGNHDIFYKTSIETHSLKYIGEFSNVTVIEKPTELTVNGKKFLLVSWQIDDSILNYSPVDKIDVCLGHFDINGFYLNKTTVFEGGFNPSFFFNNFKLTFSGHFHLYSEQAMKDSKIVYIGTPYHLTRHDIGTDKGFIVLDTDTLKYERVLTEGTIKYIKNIWPNKLTEAEVTNNIIDIHVVINDVYDESAINDYVETIEKWNPVNVNIFPQYNFNNNGKSIDLKSFKTLDEIIVDYVNERLEISTDMKKLTVEYVNELIEKAKKDKL